MCFSLPIDINSVHFSHITKKNEIFLKIFSLVGFKWVFYKRIDRQKGNTKDETHLLTISNLKTCGKKLKTKNVKY